MKKCLATLVLKKTIIKNDFEKLANSLLGNSFIPIAIFRDSSFGGTRDTLILYNQNT